MKIIHVCDGWEKWNGAANIARMIAHEQEAAGAEVRFLRWAGWNELRSADEVWVHCGWKPCLWWAALVGRHVHWMPEACYDPMRLNYHGWKKWLAGPIERFCLRRCEVLVATCAAEAGWIREYLGLDLGQGQRSRSRGIGPRVEVEDIKRFFNLVGVNSWREDSQIPFSSSNSHSNFNSHSNSLHVLYLGRRHPLKGVEFLERAVAEVNEESRMKNEGSRRVELRIVSGHFGEELERDWEWCDVLCLPTLSDNFGLVVAEALERGKRVITTDGAPAWENDGVESGRLIYLKGYRDGSEETRVKLLKDVL